MSIKSDAPGMDELSPVFIRILLPKLLPIITYIFNNILTKSSFPSSWKRAKIKPIPKPSGDLRPISILSYLSKAFERIMYKQIMKFIDDNSLLTDCQSGFRVQHSTITTLIDVSEELRQSLDARKISFLTLLDHSQAFQKVDPHIMRAKLISNFLFSFSASELVYSYMSNRFQTVFLNETTSSPLAVNQGVPQGSVLGPLLFNLYINDLPLVVQYCKVRMYADDVQLTIDCHENNIASCINHLNCDLKNISDWANSNNLSLNPAKSQCLLVSKTSIDTSNLPPVKINDQHISYVSEAKNLGVVFTSKLSWNTHILRSIGKVYGMLRSIWSQKHCTPFRTRLLLCKTYLMPTILYGCELYANCDSIHERKLNILFNNVARYVFNRRRFDHISDASIRLYGLKFNDIIKTRSLIQLHKIIYTQRPSYLFHRLVFARTNRGLKLIPFTRNLLLSNRQ